MREGLEVGRVLHEAEEPAEGTRTLTAAYDRKGHAPGSAPGAGPPPSAAGRRKLCQGEDSRPHPTSSPFSTSAVTAAATTRLRRTASRGSARSARSASTRAVTSAARPCRRRTRAARRRAGPSVASAPNASATPAASAEGCTSGPRSEKVQGNRRVYCTLAFYKREYKAL